MPHENASWEVGPGTSSRKCFRSLMYFSRSINFQTDEYSQLLHLEVCERYTPSHTKVQRFKSPWWQKQKLFFSVAKEDFKCFISIKYVNLYPNIFKKRDDNCCSNWNYQDLNHVLYLLHTRLCLYHYTTPTYKNDEIFMLQDLLFY
jgi:hypothetical protein